MARNVAEHTEGLRETRAAPDPSTEEELIVLAAAGKGADRRQDR